MVLNDYEKKHLEYLRSHLAECTVLLKNDGAFPLSEAGDIAAYGSGVRKTVKGGTGSGEVNSRYFVGVEQGLKDAGFNIVTEDWLDGYDKMYVKARKQFVKDIKAIAKKTHMPAIMVGMGKVMPEPEYKLPLSKKCEAAIYVLSRNSGEGNDREPISGDIKLSETEKRDILELNKLYDKFMLVINAGGVVDLSEIGEVKNILILSQLGVETGAALADILLGKQNPSGKLATTWAAWDDYFPMPDFGDHNDTRYNEGVYVGYRYFDSVGKKALYPFGFGLSYTTFETKADSVELDGTKVTVKATVANTGNYVGKEVVQVYVSAPAGKLDKPYQDLAGFVKTPALAPVVSEQVEVSFDLRDMASYDEERSAYILEAGKYVIRVGTSSVDTVPAAVIELDAEAVVTQARPCCGKPDFADWKPEARAEENLGDVKVISLSAESIATCAVEYDKDSEIDEAVKAVSDEQLAYMNIGGFDPKAGAMSIIGNASQNVAGAAGESTSLLKDAGFKTLVMADGPAGLRLSQQFYRDEKGAHTYGGGGMPESMLEFAGGFVGLIMKMMSGGSKAPKDAVIEEQYATAIPIGTAIAQSFNLDFAKGCGDIVGDEMNRFGVHLWLAPALNIHRSVRCGRNFEYYSEDPVVSGKMAAAVTLGVQAHKGCGVTIKHYAANNQETNRYGNNSIVSERAMREIYLKGFGICVKESQPKAVMTSYNLLNGTHTAERRDLSEDVLRAEYGFEGIIMTDWVISLMTSKADKHPKVQAHNIAAAGGDLVMPGSKGDYDDVVKALKEGTLSRHQLELNASRVRRMAEELSK